jgi:hypothetical protein
MSQWYKATTEIEVGGEEMQVVYHYLPSEGNELMAQEVHFKAINLITHYTTITEATEGLKPGAIVHAKLTKRLFNVTDILEEIAGGLDNLWNQMQAKLDDLCVEYRAIPGNEVDE